jgi:hypothetical protein
LLTTAAVFAIARAFFNFLTKPTNNLAAVRPFCYRPAGRAFNLSGMVFNKLLKAFATAWAFVI